MAIDIAGMGADYLISAMGEIPHNAPARLWGRHAGIPSSSGGFDNIDGERGDALGVCLLELVRLFHALLLVLSLTPPVGQRCLRPSLSSLEDRNTSP